MTAANTSPAKKRLEEGREVRGEGGEAGDWAGSYMKVMIKDPFLV